jgi:uncharacterized repeat protein (TIGR03803 family)
VRRSTDSSTDCQKHPEGHSSDDQRTSHADGTAGAQIYYTTDTTEIRAITESILHGFDPKPTASSDGFHRQAGRLRANDGNFYGTMVRSGTGHCGTVFRLSSTNRKPTAATTAGAAALYGTTSLCGLILGPDRNLYGTTSGSGGTVFEVTRAGAETVLHSFVPSLGTSSSAPVAPVVGDSVQALGGHSNIDALARR